VLLRAVLALDHPARDRAEPTPAGLLSAISKAIKCCGQRLQSDRSFRSA
jgi:hypothetical protein